MVLRCERWSVHRLALFAFHWKWIIAVSASLDSAQSPRAAVQKAQCPDAHYETTCFRFAGIVASLQRVQHV